MGGGLSWPLPAEEGELEEERHLLAVERHVVLALEAEVAQVDGDRDVGDGDPQRSHARTETKLELLGDNHCARERGAYGRREGVGG